MDEIYRNNTTTDLNMEIEPEHEPKNNSKDLKELKDSKDEVNENTESKEKNEKEQNDVKDEKDDKPEKDENDIKGKGVGVGFELEDEQGMKENMVTDEKNMTSGDLNKSCHIRESASSAGLKDLRHVSLIA